MCIQSNYGRWCYYYFLFWYKHYTVSFAINSPIDKIEKIIFSEVESNQCNILLYFMAFLTSLTKPHHLLLKCLYQARKVNSHVFEC